jgi:anaerobic ribonucleoside-triphosphate reductase activating protein
MLVIQLSGLTPCTTIDYPGALAAVLFCQGCPWRCGYCHNPHLQPIAKGTLIWSEVLAFLKERIGLIDAVVFSGGEPTLQRQLKQAIEQVKQLGFKIGLHTAGVHPALLTPILPLLDWIGMDIKAPFDQYERITNNPNSGSRAKQSAEAVIAQAASYEFRTTVHPDYLTQEDLDRLTLQLSALGGKHFILQEARPLLWDEFFLAKIKQRFTSCFVRTFAEEPMTKFPRLKKTICPSQFASSRVM